MSCLAKELLIRIGYNYMSVHHPFHTCITPSLRLHFSFDFPPGLNLPLTQPWSFPSSRTSSPCLRLPHSPPAFAPTKSFPTFPPLPVSTPSWLYLPQMLASSISLRRLVYVA